ncbi:TPA: MFS transporter [Vibrio cholerae]|nr:MFS transporter [Vibrio cholerae]
MIDTYKKAIKIIPINTIKLFFGLTIVFLGLAFKNFYSLILLGLFELDISTIGYFLSIIGFGSLVGTMISGYILKFSEPIRAIQIAVVLCIASTSLVLSSSHYYAAVFGMFVFSTFASGLRPALQTYLSDLQNEEIKKTAYSLYRVFISIGSALGLVICGALADFSYTLTLWFVVVCFGLSLFYFVTQDFSFEKTSKPKKEKVETKSTSPLNLEIFTTIVCTFLFSFSMFQIYSFLPIYLVEHLGLSKSFFGSLSILNLFIVLFLQMKITELLANRSNEFGMMLGGLVMFSSFGILSLGFSSQISIILQYSLWSISICMFYPSVLTKLSSLATQHNKPSSSLMIKHQFTIDITLIVGPVISGFVISQFSMIGLWYVCGLACVISILLCYSILKGVEQKKAAKEAA